MSNAFDRYQFAGRRPGKSFNKEASKLGFATTKEGYADGAHYFTIVGRSTRWIPPFVNNPAQLQAVLAEAAVRYAFQSKQVPPDLERTLANLKQLADDKTAYVKTLVQANDYWNKVSTTLEAYEGAGGYLDTIAAVSYRGWRLRWHNPDIESHMGLRKDAARDILVRLMAIAQEMGFEVYEPRSHRDVEEVVAGMWKNGAHVGLISALLEIPARQVRQVLRKLGLYTWRRHPGKGRRTHCKVCGEPMVARYRKDGTFKQMECRRCTAAAGARYRERASSI
jgi:hypothetical protein